jgi:lysophospholipase L1-like esterase
MKKILLVLLVLAMATSAGATWHNRASAGSFTVGVGGDFQDLPMAADSTKDINNYLTGNVTLTVISPLTQSRQALFNQTLWGYDYKILNPNHYTDTLTTGDVYGIYAAVGYYLQSNYGHFIVDGLNCLQQGSPTSAGYSILSAYTASSERDTIIFKNCILDRNYKPGMCAVAYSPDQTQVVRIYNCVCKNAGNGIAAIAMNGPAPASVIENCTILRGDIGFSTGSAMTLRNCIAIGQTTSAYTTTGTLGSFVNCGSGDATGSAWNFLYLTAPQCWIDTFSTDTNALRLQDDPKYALVSDSGSSAHLADDTTDILGVKRNHGGLYSIGAYTYNPRAATLGQTAIGILDTDFFAGAALQSRWQASGSSCTTSVSAGKLQFKAGPSWTNKIIDTGYGPSQLDYWKESVIFKANNTAGAVGLCAFPYKNSTICGINAYAGNASYAYYCTQVDTTVSGPTLFQSASVNPSNIQAGDSVYMSLERSKNTITFTVINLSRAGSWTGKGEVYYGSTRTPNVASFGVSCYTGNFNIYNYCLFSQQNSLRKIAILGNSITTGYYATPEEYGFARLLQFRHPGLVDVNAGGGNRTDMVAAIKNDFGKLKSKYVLSMLCINDMLGVVPLTQIKANTQTIAAKVVAAGGVYVPLTMYAVPSYTDTITAFNNWLKATYSTTIDVASLTVPLQDGLHPNTAGHLLIANYIDGIIVSRGYTGQAVSGGDSIISVYPHSTRIDSLSTTQQRTITVKVHGPNKCTANTVVWFGSQPLNQISYTDSTVTDTLFKYPTMPNGYYRVFLTDSGWTPTVSDTLLNACKLNNPSITVTNP